MTSVPQRLKGLSKTDEDDERLIQVALQKRKVAALVALTPKRAKKVQLVSEPRAFVIPSAIPRHIKTRVTKANLKIGDKEWAVSFTGNKEDSTSQSSDSESIDDTLISSLRKHASST